MEKLVLIYINIHRISDGDESLQTYSWFLLSFQSHCYFINRYSEKVQKEVVGSRMEKFLCFSEGKSEAELSIWRLSFVSSWPAWMILMESCFHNLFLQLLMSDNYYIPSLLPHKLTASEYSCWKALGITMNSLKTSSRQDNELFSVFSF